jgi:hypothetical protein
MNFIVPPWLTPGAAPASHMQQKPCQMGQFMKYQRNRAPDGATIELVLPVY